MAGAQASETVPTTALTPAQLLAVHRALVRARLAEERLEVLLRQGHVGGGVYRSLGQEGGAVGAALALRRRTDGTGDIIAQTIRSTGAVFLMGGTPLDYFRQYLARVTGPTRGREANVHWCDFRRGLLGPVSPLGTMVEVMAGITLAFRLQGAPRVGLVFAGDGASSTGAWHEGLNFAAVRRCPMVLMVEANRWAFSTPTSRQTRVESFLEKCPGYGITGVGVDGTDVLEVFEATRGAVERARSGEGVQMVELRYYRRMGHAQHDGQEYVDPRELEAWKARDPIDRFRARLLENESVSEADVRRLEAGVAAEVDEAAEKAVLEPRPEGEEALAGVWTDLALQPPWFRDAAGDRTTPHVVPAEGGPPGPPIPDPHRMGTEA